MSIINIRGKNKATVLAALVNGTHPMGYGLWHTRSGRTMTERDAAKLILSRELKFQNVWGRPINLDLGGDAIDSGDYDLHSPRTAEEILKDLN